MPSGTKTTRTKKQAIEVTPELLDAMEHAATMLGYHRTSAPRNDDEASDRNAAKVLMAFARKMRK